MKKFAICCSIVLAPTAVMAQGHDFYSKSTSLKFASHIQVMQDSSTIYGGHETTSTPKWRYPKSKYLSHTDPEIDRSVYYMAASDSQPVYRNLTSTKLSSTTSAKIPAKYKVTVMPYAGYLTYGSYAAHNSGYTTGAYVSIPSETNLVELGASYSNIGFRTDGTNDLKQTDLAFAYTHYLSPNTNVRGGMHYINTTDDSTNNGNIFFAGAKAYDGSKWHYGADAYYSMYSNSDQHVGQLSFESGYSAGNFYKEGSYYFTVTGNYIHPFDASITTLSNHYLSAGIDVAYSIPYWKTEVGGWAGRQVMAVQNDGMVVLNVPNEYNAGAHASVQKYFNDYLFAKLSYKLDWFKDVTTAKHSKKQLGLLSVGGSY
ncbi:MAG: hypothetical protein HQL69_08690 [Magnetococcales bacterium]|nr:hypothetical protein [Magnetococcales bacterium]